ncbi:MAG: 4Fe-4S binding protein [Prevotellaceae bacterium]|jgi:polyferredoxin|nr:4Fe-4S binding protein [Prevotellaceae bacterium]
MLRKIRITLAAACFVLITGLFLDFTGALHGWLGWLAQAQLVPALLALNVGVLAVLVLLTLAFGRLYCSVLCPLGIFQDIASRLSGLRKKRRFAYALPRRWLRWGALAAFAACLVAGVSPVVALLEPYSAYGRVASQLLAPLYRWGNNGLAYLAERAGSYAFYPTEVWLKSGGALLVAVATLGVIGFLAWRGGRTWCNTICPVGTALGFLSRFAWLRVSIDEEKCNACGQCARRCKASCIDSKAHKIDYSRCVACMSCLEKCKQGALRYAPRKFSLGGSATKEAALPLNGRRNFLSVAALLSLGGVASAAERVGDGGLALIGAKRAPRRTVPVVPPGALDARRFAQRCTACQLCVSACPNQVLRPSAALTRFMQPELSFERGWCRPECTRCSEVCPSGAIDRITPADKSATQIGHAVWVKERCVALHDGVTCTSCERHCPTGAIQLVRLGADPKSPKTPVIDIERCVGCGACEHLCPARPLSAIYVEGHERHKTV